MTTPNSNTAVATRQDVAVSKQEREMEFIPLGSDQSIRLSIKIVQDLICIPTKRGAICNEKEAMKFMMLCKARALNPFEGDAYLQGYDGQDGPQFSLITAHQAFLKRAEPHQEFAGMRSGVVVSEPIKCIACDGSAQLKSGKDCKRCGGLGYTDEITGDIVPQGAKLIGGWATVFFKNRPEPMHKRLSLAVFDKGFSRWKVDAAGMIVKCAEADALRSSFPTKLGGLFLREEQESITQRPETARGIFGAAGVGTEIERAAITESASTPDETEQSPQPERRAAKTAKAQSSSPVIDNQPTEQTPKTDLVNDKTRLAQWIDERGFGWPMIQPIASRVVGNWADAVGSFEDLNAAQAKAIYTARAAIEAALVPTAT